MSSRARTVLLPCLWLALPSLAPGQNAPGLSGTAPLTISGDLSTQMVAGIDRFLLRETERALVERPRFWARNPASPAAYAASVQTNRWRLALAIGAVDTRVPVNHLELIGSTGSPAKVAERTGTACGRCAGRYSRTCSAKV